MKATLLAGTGVFALVACVQTTLAPGANKVIVTRNPGDVANCKAVGNIDGKSISGFDVLAQMQNQAVGLGGNRVLETSDGTVPSGVVYRCPAP